MRDSLVVFSCMMLSHSRLPVHEGYESVMEILLCRGRAI